MKTKLFACQGIVFVLLAVLTVSAGAQTPSRSIPRPANAPVTEVQKVQRLPMPDSVLDQTREQFDGNYGQLVRPRSPGQIQEQWDESDLTDAVYITAICDGCVYKMRLREWVVSVIELPRGERIGSADIGDPDGFKIQTRGDNRMVLRPTGAGYDSTLLIYGDSGRVYPFYLRAEGFNSKNSPDVVFRITGRVSIEEEIAVPGIVSSLEKNAEPDAVISPTDSLEKSGSHPDLDKIVADLTTTNPTTPRDDFVANVEFDPAKLRGFEDYEMWGDDDSLVPERVYRDDHFTYIDFGEKWKDMELPVAYVVVDEIDETVNTRVQGKVFIVESTRELISLKSGKSFLCIKYTGT
tara:strand:- start:9696 stop:10748 length:1053 start_codon:yes stop_codon:yes gene_type:complete